MVSWVPLALIALALAGCGSALGRAEAQFRSGQYPDAKQILTELEAQSRTWADAERAEYDLYRGLTHAALGDREQAGLWLREAQAIEDAHPSSLSHEDKARLKVAAENLGQP